MRRLFLVTYVFIPIQNGFIPVRNTYIPVHLVFIPIRKEFVPILGAFIVVHPSPQKIKDPEKSLGLTFFLFNLFK